MLLVPAAHALDKRDFARHFSVGRPVHVAHGGTGSGKDAFKLEGVDHVGVSSQAVLLRKPGVVDFITGGQNEGADVDLLLPLHHVVLDRPDAAFVIAAKTLRTDPAGQAAGRFRLRFLFRISQVHFLERGGPLGRPEDVSWRRAGRRGFPRGSSFLRFRSSVIFTTGNSGWTAGSISSPRRYRCMLAAALCPAAMASTT